MPQLEYFLVCESMATDRETNRVSLFNILEDLQIGESEGVRVPVLAQFVAISCWNQSPGDEDQDFQATLRIHFPGKDEVTSHTLNFKMELLRHRLTHRLLGMPKLQTGQLKFEILLNGEHIAWHTVNIFPSAGASSSVRNDNVAE